MTFKRMSDLLLSNGQAMKKHLHGKPRFAGISEENWNLSVDDDLYGRALSAVAFAFRDTARSYTQSYVHQGFQYDSVSCL